MFVHYTMKNTSTRKDQCDNITIEVTDTFTGEVVGTARVKSFTDIYLELPEVQGRYELRKPALRQLESKMIKNLDDAMRYSWLLSDGAWLLKNLKKVKTINAGA